MTNRDDARDLSATDDPPQRKRPPTSGTRHGNGVGHGGPARGPGLWGEANGMGWGGQSRSSGTAPMAHTLTPEERRAHRARLREEMIGLYYEIATDADQPPMARLWAAQHLLERLDNNFDKLFGDY